jgi:hypothetical protein
MVAADARTAIAFSLSPGHDHDAPHGRALLEELGPMPEGLPLLMDRAYEGNETRQLVLDLGMIPVVPPKSNRLHRGTMITHSIRSATRSSGYSAGSKDSAASSHASKNSTSYFWLSSPSRSLSKP